eukprot:TRINITY_DN65747_c0_g1_i4.p1 TRINITY_DN65747_c0_g1~~TRINITY_DN65747_c0_g1_i4.p1  ORF type:complete len:476 (-),score=22.58 TRINITY_DN65747_c0_g1_i4:146-1573(-)
MVSLVFSDQDKDICNQVEQEVPDKFENEVMERVENSIDFQNNSDRDIIKEIFTEIISHDMNEDAQTCSSEKILVVQQANSQQMPAFKEVALQKDCSFDTQQGGVLQDEIYDQIKTETYKETTTNENIITQNQKSGAQQVHDLIASLRPKDLKRLLDKITGRHRRRHTWAQMTEYEEKLEDQFTPPLSDHDEITRCMECGRKHTTPNGLFWHLDVSHKWSFQLTRLKATTSCPVCNVFCGHWYNMSLHVIEVHGQRNWWKEVDRDIMLIQPAQAQLEEEVTKLDKPIDRRISLILSSSLNRVSRLTFSLHSHLSWKHNKRIWQLIWVVQFNIFLQKKFSLSIQLRIWLLAMRKKRTKDLGEYLQQQGYQAFAYGKRIGNLEQSSELPSLVDHIQASFMLPICIYVLFTNLCCQCGYFFQCVFWTVQGVFTVVDLCDPFQIVFLSFTTIQGKLLCRFFVDLLLLWVTNVYWNDIGMI